MTQGRKSGLNRLLSVILVLAVLAGIVWAAFSMARGWTPSRDQYPLQGVTVNAVSGAISWRALAAQGVNFGYIEATRGSDIRDERFIENYREASAAEIGFAPLHHYSLCRLASDQAENFVTTVPRDEKAMPAAIVLEFDEECTSRPTQSLVVSELITFLNQVESHMGKRAILRVSPQFEKEYSVSSAIARDVWLTGNYFPPDYASKAWVMWTANDRYSIDGAEQPIAWNVIRSEKPSSEETSSAE
ncbi:MAG: GH25 family lysozyme [Pseudomonadota bacterium]